MIEDKVVRKIKELDEFHNSSCSDRQVASMNCMIDEQKMMVYSKAMDEVCEVSNSVFPLVFHTVRELTRGLSESMSWVIHHERLQNQLKQDDVERVKNELKLSNKQTEKAIKEK